MPAKPSLVAAAAPFLPEIVRALLETNPQPMVPPWSLRFEGAVVRVLIEGFPALVETFGDRPQDGVRLMSQAVESFFGDRVGIVHAFGGSTVLLDGLGMVLLFPADASPEARFLAGRAALGACLHLRGAAGPGRSRLGARGPSVEVRLGCHLGEVTLGAVGTREWHLLIGGPGVEGADVAALNAQSGDVMATDGLLGWVGTVRTEGTFHRGMASVTALPPPEDRLEPIYAGLKGSSDELQKRILEAVSPEVRDWAQAGGGPWPSRFEPATIVHATLEGLGSQGDLKAVEKLHIVVERAAKLVEEAGGRIEAADLGEAHAWLSLSFTADPGAKARLRSALHAALELRKALRLPFLKGLRAGVVSGTVFRTALGGAVRRQVAIFGPPVEAALRLASLAAPGQILVDAQDREEAGSLFEFEVINVRLTAAGLKARETTRRVQNREVSSLLRSLDPLHRTSLEAHFIGREIELALCENALMEARSGRGAALLVRGERGMGKTSLLREVASKAKDMGVPAARSTSRPARGPLDLQPLADLLAQLSGGAEPPEAPPEQEDSSDEAAKTEARELARSLATELRRAAESAPLLLILEDLHLASRLASSLARKIAAMLAGLPVVFLISEEPPTDPGATPSDGTLEIIELPPLAEEEITELAAHLREGRPLAAELLPAVSAGCRGNPLHLAELLWALDALPPEQQTPEALAALPSALPDLLAWRLERLEPELLSTLQLAASLVLPAPLEQLRERHPEGAGLSELMSRLAARGFPLPLSGHDPVLVDFAELLHREVLLARGLPPATPA